MIASTLSTKEKSKMNQAEKYLYELMYCITTTHLDMGGKHCYALRASGFKLVSEIRAWMALQQDINKLKCEFCGCEIDHIRCYDCRYSG